MARKSLLGEDDMIIDISPLCPELDYFLILSRFVILRSDASLDCISEHITKLNFGQGQSRLEVCALEEIMPVVYLLDLDNHPLWKFLVGITIIVIKLG